MNIITDRVLVLIQGNPIEKPQVSSNEMSEYSIPVLSEPQIKPPTENITTPTTNPFQEMAPMAANDALGGAFGSSF